MVERKGANPPFEQTPLPTLINSFQFNDNIAFLKAQVLAIRGFKTPHGSKKRYFGALLWTQLLNKAEGETGDFSFQITNSPASVMWCYFYDNIAFLEAKIFTVLSFMVPQGCSIE